jgi:hypothetical protein
MSVRACICAVNTKEEHTAVNLWGLLYIHYICITLTEAAAEVSLFVSTPLRKVDREGGYYG